MEGGKRGRMGDSHPFHLQSFGAKKITSIGWVSRYSTKLTHQWIRWLCQSSRSGVFSPNGLGNPTPTKNCASVQRAYTISKSKCNSRFAACNELHYYKPTALVTYRFGISVRYTGNRRGEVSSPNGLGNPTPTKDCASVQRAYTISKSKCYDQSEALNELGNYKLPIHVTYRVGISVRYNGNRRGEVASPNGLGNPTPTKDYASVQRAYTISKSKCNSQSEALNELSNYKLPIHVTYRVGISVRYNGNRRGGVASPNGLGNPTPTKDCASMQCAYTISKSKCYDQSEALNELSNYKLPIHVTYRFGISERFSVAEETEF